MDAYSDSVQRIARLTPLGDVLAIIEERVAVVKPQQRALVAALGRTLAADVRAPVTVPPAPVALRDGFAVAAELVADAGPYAPVALSAACTRVDSGEALPPGCDAVAPLEAIVHASGAMQAVVPVGPGEGVLPAGGDVQPDAVLARAGERLSSTRLAALAVCGIHGISVREPRVRLCRASARPEFVTAAYDLIATGLEAAGALLVRDPPGETSVSAFEAALDHADADAIVAIGGTGSGRGDASVATLRRRGRLEAHGIGIAPGETAAFGFAGPRPVLLVPGRLDAALAVWLLLGVPLMRRLTGCIGEEATSRAKLMRKISSTLGLAELVPVVRRGDEVEPLGRGHLPLATLLRADGWMLAGAESEGFPAGAAVQVRSFP